MNIEGFIRGEKLKLIKENRIHVCCIIDYDLIAKFTGGESLIIDSVKEIRDVEKQIEKEIFEAKEKGKSILNTAIEEGQERAKEIISDANREAEERVEARTREAELISEQVLKKGNEELQYMRNLKDEDLKKAVDFVLERIVI